MSEMVPTSVEMTEVSLKILRVLYPGRTEMTAGNAMDDVAQVLGLERVLRRAIDECEPGDWRCVAAVILRTMREPCKR